MMLGREEGFAISVLVNTAGVVPVVGNIHSMFTPRFSLRPRWNGDSFQLTNFSCGEQFSWMYQVTVLSVFSG